MGNGTSKDYGDPTQSNPPKIWYVKGTPTLGGCQATYGSQYWKSQTTGCVTAKDGKCKKDSCNPCYYNTSYQPKYCQTLLNTTGGYPYFNKE